MTTHRRRAGGTPAPRPFAPAAIPPTEPLPPRPGEPVHPRTTATGAFPPPAIRHYRFVRSLGAGGMGRVYLYKDTKLQRDVAIKFVRELANRAAILSEAQAAAQVRHPGVVAIHEVDEESGFIVFEYVDGQPLNACLPVSSDRLLPLARDIARALAEVHGTGLVHGDIKPANIMLETATASPKLIDFGLAFHHDESLAGDASPIAGTPAYLAPELPGRQPAESSLRRLRLRRAAPPDRHRRATARATFRGHSARPPARPGRRRPSAAVGARRPHRRLPCN